MAELDQPLPVRVDALPLATTRDGATVVALQGGRAVQMPAELLNGRDADPMVVTRQMTDLLERADERERTSRATAATVANNAAAAVNAAGAAAAAATTSTTSSASAAASAALVLSLVGNSTTSLAVGTGDKTFTVEAGKGFAPGLQIRASSKAAPAANAMIGVVKSYSGTTLVLTVESVLGAGTYADWAIAVTGGALAPVGSTQDAQAIVQMSRLERSLAAAGIPDESSLVLDFIRGVHFASKTAITASIVTLIAALGGVSTFARASTGTFWGEDGLLKTAANNVPRIEYDPVSRLPRGLLIENQARTNSVINNVNLSSCSQANATRTANAAASPDGTMTMSRFTSTVNGGANTCVVDMVVTIPNDTVTRTFSLFLRQGTAPSSLVNFYYSGGTFISAFATINWSTKTIVGDGNPKLVDCGGGLYRASVTFANNGSGNTQAVCRVYVRDGFNNVMGEYVDTGTWQLEEGAAMSSPIITADSAVTRAADVLALAGAQWITGSGQSACVEVDFNQSVSNGVSAFYYATTSTGANYLVLREGAVITGTDFVAGTGGGTVIDSASLGAPLGIPVRYAFGEDGVGWAYAKDNAAPLTGGAITAPSGMDRLLIGANDFMGHIRLIIVFPKRLSSAKVQALSSQAWN